MAIMDIPSDWYFPNGFERGTDGWYIQEAYNYLFAWEELCAFGEGRGVNDKYDKWLEWVTNASYEVGRIVDIACGLLDGYRNPRPSLFLLDDTWLKLVLDVEGVEIVPQRTQAYREDGWRYVNGRVVLEK